MIRYLSVEQVLSLHQGLVGHLRGDAGVRDLRALEAAAARPTLSFEGDDLYPTVEAKAAALLHSLASTSPFVDASRETALLAAECFLQANGVRLQATDRDLDRLDASLARGEMSVEALTVWLGQRLREAR